MNQMVYILFLSLLVLDFVSPTVAFLWVNCRTRSLWQAIRASVLTATVGAFLVSGIVGCLLFVPAWLSGGDPPNWTVFLEAGLFGLIVAEVGLVCLFLCALGLVIYRLTVTADLPSEPTGEREPQCKL